MPKQVDHRERREAIAQALWRVVEQQRWPRATMREVAREAEVSLGQLQHYFSSRTAMLTFAMEFAAEQTSDRVARALTRLDRPPRRRDVLRVVLTEPASRVTDRIAVRSIECTVHRGGLPCH